MKIQLNEKKAAELKPKNERYEVRDLLVRGLILRIGKKGEKVWEAMVSRAGKRKRVRLGTFPAVSVKEARKLADEGADLILPYFDWPESTEEMISEYRNAL